MPAQIEGTVTQELHIADGRVKMDGDLTIGIDAFNYEIDGVRSKYNGATAQAVTDDDTSYVYLDSSGTLVINTTGWPGDVHLRLARVVATSGIISQILNERVFLAAAKAGGVPATRQINSGEGMTGGGDLSQDRTLNVALSDTAHGDRGGGSLHAAATQSVAGFMSAADKTTLDNIGTKKKFFPADPDANIGDYRAQNVLGTGDHRFNIVVPSDFTSLVSLKLYGICSVGAAGSGKDIDLDTDYAAHDEPYNQHSESDTTTTYDFTGKTDKIISIDLSGVFSSLAAGDFGGVHVDHKSIGGTISYLGVLMEYNT